MGDIMDNLTRFKRFVRGIPNIKQEVDNGNYSWQDLYDLYMQSNGDDPVFNRYKSSSIDDLFRIIKNLDQEQVTNCIDSINRMLNILIQIGENKPSN